MSTDTWSLVESSKPKCIDRWKIPTRWRVKYAPCPTFEGMTYWAVLVPGAVVPVARFKTWREALDCADRQARTREYVLPRVLGSGEWVPGMPTLRLGWENHPTEKTFWVEDQGRGSITIRPDELLPLALALAALTEQEGTA